MTSTPYLLPVFLPFLSFLLVGTLGKMMGRLASCVLACSLMAVGAVTAGFILYEVIGHEVTKLIPLFTWIDTGALHVKWSLYFDPLTTSMVAMVSIISFLIHVYSVGYMEQDPAQERFMAYLGLFTFMMLMLVTSDNLLQLFFGWEGVGLASYLLIGFWYHRPSACAASMKAFIVNRVGDVGLALGIAAVFYIFRTVDISLFLPHVVEVAEESFVAFSYEIPALEVMAFLLFIGAMGKSAQLGLHTWLPDAMEGPTPVSALIHAATMVTAGVFLIARLSPLFEMAPHCKSFIVIVGATTAFFAGTVALTQTDIKRVIAYSTCSQLGYMFFAAGLSAYHLAIFHLLTHAFFKALLFLGAGAVIHAMSDEQNMEKMGGIWRHIPVTYTLMWIGSLALAGIPYFAGYYSKDAILNATWLSGENFSHYAYFLGIAGAFLTAFYSWRLLMMTFHGQPKADERVMSHLHEPGLTMIIPLILLSLGAVFAGLLGEPFITDPLFWRESLIFLSENTPLDHLPPLIHHTPLILAGTGVVLGIIVYGFRPSIAAALQRTFEPLYTFLKNKWYFDELYNAMIVQPSQTLSRFLWQMGDTKIIDGYGPNGFAARVLRVAQRVSALQTGYLYHYAFAFFVGGIALVAWMLLRP
jgi:NADH-quinone oxidoreductase subunit L